MKNLFAVFLGASLNPVLKIQRRVRRVQSIQHRRENYSQRLFTTLRIPSLSFITLKLINNPNLQFQFHRKSAEAVFTSVLLILS